MNIKKNDILDVIFLIIGKIMIINKTPY